MTKNHRGPIIRMAPDDSHGAGGIQCCWCRCCTCIHIEFLKTLPGAVKVAETVKKNKKINNYKIFLYIKFIE